MLEGDSEFFSSDEIRASIDNLNKNFEKVPKITHGEAHNSLLHTNKFCPADTFALTAGD